MTLTISGKAYRAACDPNASQVPTEEGWPTPTATRRGKGWQYHYEATAEQADLIESHLRVVGECLLWADPEARAEGRACIAAADRIAANNKESN